MKIEYSELDNYIFYLITESNINYHHMNSYFREGYRQAFADLHNFINDMNEKQNIINSYKTI